MTRPTFTRRPGRGRAMPLIRWALLLGGVVVAAGAGLWLTAPQRLPAAATAGLTGDAGRGAAVFHAAGCASCHMPPGAGDAAPPVLAGGQEFPSPFGTFVAPNISPDPTHGIGGWTLAMLADALVMGTSPEGAHYYPALPYASYEKADLQDIADLYAYLMTLPAAATPSPPHRIGFPFNLRPALGLWKALYTGRGWAVQGDLTAQETRGRYLAEALAHCGECHTPRDRLGGMDLSRWLAGAPNPSGQGTIPNITPAKLTWSAEEVTEYLTTGFTPDFDSAGGHMAQVVTNLARLPAEDRAAIAAYLQRVPAVE